jgi:hypothetical protein
MLLLSAETINDGTTLGELVQVAILNDFRFERSMTPGREAARPSLTWHPALPTDRNAMAAETTAHHTKTVV